MNNFSKPSQNKINGGLIFLIMIFAFLLSSLIGQAILLAFGVDEGLLFTAVNSLFSILAIIFAIAFVKISSNESCRKLCSINKFEWFYILPALLLSAGMFCGLGFLNYAVASVFYSLGLKPSAVSISVVSFWDLLIFTLCVGVLPAVFEECFFRGVLLSNLKGRSYLVILTLSFCFAIYHGNFIQFFYQLIYGFALYLLAVKSKSVLPGVISHFINNFVVILLVYLKAEINFFSPVLICIGLMLLALFFICLVFYRKKESCFSVQLSGETSLSSFFVPFGAIAVFLMTLLALLGLFA